MSLPSGSALVYHGYWAVESGQKDARWSLSMVEPHHAPVMVKEVLDALDVRSGGKYIDCTVGEGGHSAEIRIAADPAPRLLGLDVDEEALSTAKRRLGGGATLVQGSYRELMRLAETKGFMPADGVLLDLGLSSLQVESGTRGFSFLRPGPLDMRFDRSQELTAHHIVNEYGEEELANLIYRLGEERKSRRIARAIVRSRPIEDTVELAEVVRRSMGKQPRRRTHPATRTFQAIRMETNAETEAIEEGVRGAIGVLRPGGRLAVISYHSLEDRLVKRLLAREASSCVCPPEAAVCACGHEPRVRLVNRRVVKPSRSEVETNPRSRSAKLRAAERI